MQRSVRTLSFWPAGAVVLIGALVATEGAAAVTTAQGQPASSAGAALEPSAVSQVASAAADASRAARVSGPFVLQNTQAGHELAFSAADVLQHPGSR